MASKRKHLKKKIASLSALGAGALVFGATEADAAVIYSGPINAHVGYGPGGTDFYQSPGLGPAGATFYFFRTTAPASFPYRGRAIVASACGCLNFGTNGSVLRLFGLGAVWTPLMTAYSSALVGARRWGSFPGSGSSGPVQLATAFGNASFNDKYSLFRFDDGPTSYYGWIHLSFSIDGQFGDNPEFGPDLLIHDWAYDDSGALLAAGTGAETPEPGNAVSTGLAALALGAVGLRRWRKTRPAA
jgi:hypothetical protein